MESKQSWQLHHRVELKVNKVGGFIEGLLEVNKPMTVRADVAYYELVSRLEVINTS